MITSYHIIRDALFSHHRTIQRCIVLGSNDIFNYRVSKQNLLEATREERCTKNV